MQDTAEGQHFGVGHECCHGIEVKQAHLQTGAHAVGCTAAHPCGCEPSPSTAPQLSGIAANSMHSSMSMTGGCIRLSIKTCLGSTTPRECCSHFKVTASTQAKSWSKHCADHLLELIMR